MASSDRILHLGFMPLIDSAPLVAAARLGFDRKHGLRFELHRQASWAAIRDKLVSGELDAVHALSGLVHGVHLGVGGMQASLAVLLTLNHNGQSITVSQPLAQRLAEGASAQKALSTLGRVPVFAQTFPTGTHAMWLYYWLAANGVNPLSEVRSIVIPPPRMAEALAAGEIDGYCSGEPWGLRAEVLGIGRRIVRSSEIWPEHPEKVLACRADFVALEVETALALAAAILEACRWLDDASHRREALDWLTEPEVIGLPIEFLSSCLLGDAHTVTRFHNNGAVNVPYRSDGLWFASQFRRWGLLAPDIDESRCEAAIASIQRLEEYRQAAARVGVPVPSQDRRESVLCDGVQWTGRDALAYADSFKIGARFMHT